ncbi:hypothetical protein [Umezawaea beigongshangensis]|nr:hypothetical protein [Umezawaea beigongshangensis]
MGGEHGTAAARSRASWLRSGARVLCARRHVDFGRLRSAACSG